MIDVVLSGAGGRLGRRTLACIARAADLRLVSALVRSGSDTEGQDTGILSGNAPSGISTSDRIEAIQAGRVLIEMATRRAAFSHAKRAYEVGAPMLIATTGFEKKEEKAIAGFSDKCPVLVAPNLSLGVTVLTDLVRRAAKALAGYDLELLETHHRKKRDAPSGTAWALARAVAEARGQDLDRDAILARSGETGPRGDQEIGLQTLRGGDVVGEHTVYLFGETERLELTHRAQSRDAFAHGAVAAAQFLGRPGRKPGRYTMRDVLGLEPFS